MCPQVRAHWRHLVNTIELVLPSTLPSPQPKRQIDRFSRFCTAHDRKCLYFTMGTLNFPQNCHLLVGDRDPHLFHDSLGQTEPTIKLHHNRFSYFRTGDRRVSLHFTMGAPFPQNCPFPLGIWTPCKTRFLGPIQAHRPNGISIGSAVFCTDDRRVSLYFTMGRPFSPLKIAPSHEGSGPPSNTWFPGPTLVLNPNYISIGSAVLTGLTSVTDRQTDRPH